MGKNAMSFYIFFLKVKELNLEILPIVRYIYIFVFFNKFYLIIWKIKAQFLVGKNKYVYEYCKIIWIPSPKCNTIFKFVSI